MMMMTQNEALGFGGMYVLFPLLVEHHICIHLLSTLPPPRLLCGKQSI
jgi:hypothetical protein